MNKLVYKLFSITLVCVLLGISGQLFAASQDKKKHEPTRPSYEDIQMQKVAFYSSELQLTPEEAQKFWPLYNELWQKRENARKESMGALRSLMDKLNSDPNVSDSEIKKLSEIYLANQAMESELLNEYFDKFQKILPVKKAAKIFYAEEKFRRMLIKQLRHAPNHGPQPR